MIALLWNIKKESRTKTKVVKIKLSRTYFTHPDFASLVDRLYDKS
jgi:hypothetical protein